MLERKFTLPSQKGKRHFILLPSLVHVIDWWLDRFSSREHVLISETRMAEALFITLLAIQVRISGHTLLQDPASQVYNTSWTQAPIQDAKH